jgi:hypothetical protein
MKKFTITIIALIAVSCSDAGDEYISLMCGIEGDNVNLILNKENFTFDLYMPDDPNDIKSGTYQEQGKNHFQLMRGSFDAFGLYLDRRSLLLMSQDYYENCQDQDCSKSQSDEYAICKKIDLPEKYLNKASVKNQI